MKANDIQTARPVFLLGYMASGKTTLGRALAAAAGRRFVDLDEYIEDKAGKTVNRIFAEDGEPAFRRLEAEALAELADYSGDDGLIVACGGGTPCFGGNMELMNSKGLTVRLVTSEKVIIRRLVAERSSRPLVARLSAGVELERYVSENMARREAYYSRAAASFDSSRLESEAEVTQSVKLFIDKFLQQK